MPQMSREYSRFLHSLQLHRSIWPQNGGLSARCASWGHFQSRKASIPRNQLGFFWYHSKSHIFIQSGKYTCASFVWKILCYHLFKSIFCRIDRSNWLKDNFSKIILAMGYIFHANKLFLMDFIGQAVVRRAKENLKLDCRLIFANGPL